MFKSILRKGETIKTGYAICEPLKIAPLPLVVKANMNMSKADYDIRLEDLKKQYGGPVVLLKYGEEAIRH